MKHKTFLLLFVTVLLSTMFAASAHQTSDFASKSITQSPKASPIESSVPPATEWNKTYGGPGSQVASSVKQTTDGGYILIGYNWVNYWLVKIDSQGNMLWNKTYRKTGFESIHACGQQTSDGGYIIAGSISAYDKSTCDVWLIKIDGIGNVEWNKTYGGEGHEVVFSAQQTIDGGYIMAGTSAPPGINNDDFYLISTDYSGNILWSKTYGVATANEIAWSVQQTSDGGYILAGDKNPFSASWTDAWVVKTDTNGNMVWNKTYGEPVRGDWIYCVRTTTDGGYIMAGCYNRDPERSSESGDFWLMKTDNAGNVQWSGLFGAAYRYGSANSIQQTIDGGFIAVGEVSTGEYQSDVWLIKTDSSGGMVWNKTFGGSGSAVIQTNDRGYAVAGASPWISVEDGTDMLLIKMMRANPPVACFTYSPSTPSVREEIIFNASSSFDLDEDIVSYHWDFDDGNVSSRVDWTIVHTFESPGIYNVTLTVIDSKDLNSSYSQIVWARIVTFISISTSSASTFAGFSVNVTGTLFDIYGNGLRNETVVLYYTVGGTETWTPIASETTDDLGNYFATWVPSTVGYFEIKSEWAGNQTHFATSNITNLEVLYITTTVSISLSSSTSYVGFKVEINGILISDIGSVSNTPILLSYSVTRGQTWSDVALINTVSDGGYSVVWMPPATGNYLVRASWTGNSTYLGTSSTINLAVIPFEEQNVFSVTSNSTISALAFNSTSKELSFTVTGLSGTTGYANVYIAKTLVENAADVKVYLNGNQINYTATSLDVSWLLHFTYLHSTHEVIVVLGQVATPFIEDLFWTFVLCGLVIAAIAILIGLYILKRRQQSRTLTEFSEALGKYARTSWRGSIETE